MTAPQTTRTSVRYTAGLPYPALCPALTLRPASLPRPCPCRAAPPRPALPALPCPALPCPALPCPALPCPALPCAALPCPALPCPALPCPALPCLTLPCPPLPCPALPCPALPSRSSHVTREGQVVCWVPLAGTGREDPQPDTHPKQQCLVVQYGCLCVERRKEAESKKAPLEGGLGGEP